MKSKLFSNSALSFSKFHRLFTPVKTWATTSLLLVNGLKFSQTPLSLLLLSLSTTPSTEKLSRLISLLIRLTGLQENGGKLVS